MDFPSPKEIKKLADACRKAGIKQFKSGSFEFTLTEEAPVSNYKKTKKSKDIDTSDSAIESDLLSEESLLFWSTGNIDETQKVEGV